MKEMRILQFVTVMNRGGMETYLMNILRAMDRRQVHMDFLAASAKPGDYDAEIAALGSCVLHIDLEHCNRFLRPLQKAFLLRRYLRKLRPQYDVFSVNGSHALDSFLFAAAALSAGVPHVAVHSHSAFLQNAFYRKLRHILQDHLIAHRFFRLLLPLLPVTRLACSKEAGECLYGRASFAVMPNGIDAKKFAFDPAVREQVRQELSLSDRHVVGHVGRFCAVKNHTYLIDVMNELARLDERAVLLLVGAGELEPAIREKIAALQLTDRVLLLGLRADTDRLYQAMDLFVMPSLYEGLPVTLIEAQASGLRCLVSDVITREADITGDVTFESIQEPPAVWANRIVTLLKDCAHRDQLETIRAAGFDARFAAQRLLAAYSCNTPES